ncbi:hypothetical protein COV06_00610 [Candidatus Uhrbacteria bacterium CG10_big_fil_rev_8_21_14_0_10_50_16]|uniref:DUF2065 domain-containing protein n=1 Tax=Candidatus Uhrbacteria bacterium CG10_big_fil_rev_8_21_14_0_10_50_16 TaxID=1975039 RepID=A0A2H0RN05_9BACT|nr:MAG: hypothetical protein COV06_00610 [Candidatus Uhrbacteria bacterium CG10_big_fil_rev_8_21_14_0_10_50_16]
MSTSIWLGQIIAIYCLIAGLGIMFNAGYVESFIKEIRQSHMVMYISGLLSLLIGLAILYSHNGWEGWAVLITLFGWMAVVKGVFIILLPHAAIRVVRLWKSRMMLFGSGVVIFVLGAIFGVFSFLL